MNLLTLEGAKSTQKISDSMSLTFEGAKVRKKYQFQRKKYC